MASKHPSADEVFGEAILRAPGEARSAYLDEACGDDLDLRERVDRLLRAFAEAGSFLESPAADPCPADAATDQPATEKPGTQIGPYKLLQQIGEGGMGVVYMAEQSEPVERRVALKIIKPGMDTREVIARFEAERQALALMDHPNIAKVLDAGTTDEIAPLSPPGRGVGGEGAATADGTRRVPATYGRPYFVMELVKGIPITEYCDREHLTPKARLELFVPVCQAVQHAHQKGIIHRDIKPTNVLVAEYDDRPVPKIIDFGVAKAIQQRLTERTVFTQLGQVVGTIDYMSPEQAKLNELDVDTRSDVYSLGVLLYELLTGETPFDRERLRSAAFDELLRIIREEEPPKPSHRLSSSQSLPSIAANRQVEPKKLSTLVRGELDWIVMKALEKDRSRRYETANALAGDVERYLADEPVVACPPSVVYRFRKFTRRNRAALVMLATVGVILLLAALVSTWQAIRTTRAFRSESAARHDAEHARREAEGARREAERDLDRAVEAERVAREQRDRAQAAEERAEANFLKARAAVDEYFTSVSDSELLSVPGLQPLRRKLMTAALKYYEGFVEEQSDLQIYLAGAHFRIGLIREELSGPEAARRSFGQAIGLLEAMRQRGQDTAAVKRLLAGICSWAGRHDESVRLCKELLADDPDDVEASVTLGYAYHQLGIAEMWAGRLDAALKWHEHAYTIWEDLTRRFPNDPKHLHDLGGNLSLLGMVLSRQGLCRSALDLHLQNVACSQRAYEQDPSSFESGKKLALSLMNAAEVQALLGFDEEALATFERLVAVSRTLVYDNPASSLLRGDLFQAWQALGKHQEKLGRTDAAEGSFRAAQEVLESIPRQTPEQMFALAIVYSRLATPRGSPTGSVSDSELAESERNADLAIQMLSKAVNAGYLDVQTLKTWPDLNPLRGRDDFRELVATLEKTVQPNQVAARPAGTEAEKPVDRGSADTLLPERVGEPAETGEYWQVVAVTRNAIGVMQMELKQYDEAERSFQRAIKAQEELQKQQPDMPDAGIDLAKMRLSLGRLYWESNESEKAEQEFVAAVAAAPDERDIWIASARVWDQLAEKTRAEADWKKALNLIPAELLDDDLLTWTQRACLYAHLGRYDEADRDFEISRKLAEAQRRNEHRQPADGSAHRLAEFRALELEQFRRRADAYLRARRWTDAAGDYSAAIDLKPDEMWFYHERGYCYFKLRQFQDMAADYTRAAELSPESPGNWSRRGFAHVKLGRPQQALADYIKAIEGWRTQIERASRGESAGVSHAPEPWNFTSFAELIRAQAKPAEVSAFYAKLEAACREDLAVVKKRFGDADRKTEVAMGFLASVLCEEAKLADAEAVWREELEIEKRLSGDDHPLVANSLVSLADVLRKASKLVEAETALREALAIRTNRLGKDAPHTASTSDALGMVLREQGKFADAEVIFRERLAQVRSRASSDDPALAGALAQLTSLLLAQKKFAEAETTARECLAIREKKMPENWLTFNARSMLGGSLLGQKKHKEAEPLLLSGYEGMKEREAEIRADMRTTRLKEALGRLVQLYEETNQPEKADPWKEKLTELDSGPGEDRQGA